MAGLASTIEQMEEGFLKPFYHFLTTGTNSMDKKTFTNLYYCVIFECDRNDRANTIYRYARKILLEFCRGRMAGEVVGVEGDALLMAWLRCWGSFKIFVHSFNKMFSYLSQFYLENSNKRKIPDECLRVFKKECWTPIRQNLRLALRDMINRGRSGEQVNRDAIKAAIQSYRAMGLEHDPKTVLHNGIPQWEGKKNLAIYYEYFEKPYLKDTAKAYTRMSKIWIASENVMEYLKHVE